MILKSLHKSVWLNELFLQSLPTFFVFRLVNHGSSFSCACNVWFISSLHLGCLTCLYSCPSRVTELGVKPWEQCVSIGVFCYIQPEQIKHINEYSLLHLNNNTKFSVKSICIILLMYLLSLDLLLLTFLSYYHLVIMVVLFYSIFFLKSLSAIQQALIIRNNETNARMLIPHIYLC